MFFYLLTAMARSSTARNLLPLVMEGRAQTAASAALEFLEGDEPGVRTGAAAMEQATLAADLMLAQDRAEEAEDLYRIALKAATAAPRGQVRVISCRNTGFISLYQRRYGTALTSFQRMAEDDAATMAQQIEALAGMALTHHAVGRRDLAGQALDDACERIEACERKDGVAETAMLSLLIRMVRIELAVQYAVRTNAALGDHIFWQSDAAYASGRCPEAETLADIQACLVAAGGRTLLVQRLHYLASLVRACLGDARAVASSHEHLSWLRGMHLSAPERQCRLESALMAIVTRNADLARSLLEPLCTKNAEGPQRWNFEVSYCRAKLCEMTGQNEECLRHYQRYALESLTCLRMETHRQPAGKPSQGRAGSSGDEVELALPAKYRRAYRYLLAHMERADLSVHEIAEHIGVTERALQSAFRSHLGMTPVEVLRRNRVERIHDDLLNGQTCGQTVIETAARWGISNRSTLVSSYRKHFRETPADTLARRDPVTLSA